jgi:hypothetical protein
MVVATGTATTLLGGVTLAAGNVDQFTVAIDPDTVNEEIVFITGISGDTFTIVRARSGSTGITHASGATVRHVLTSDDLNFFKTAIQPATLTAKGDMYVATASGVVTNLPAGADGYVLTADSTQAKGLKWNSVAIGYSQPTIGSTAIPSGATVATIAGLTLTSPTVNTPTVTNGYIVSPKEKTTVSATAATGTVNFDVLTQGVLYYTSNASANWTLNFRGNSGTTLNSLLSVGDSWSVVFLNTSGTTAYYPTVFQIDGSAVTPKWVGGTAPTSGNVSSLDSYTFTIIKTASTPTYTVLAGQARFA